MSRELRAVRAGRYYRSVYAFRTLAGIKRVEHAFGCVRGDSPDAKAEDGLDKVRAWLRSGGRGEPFKGAGRGSPSTDALPAGEDVVLVRTGRLA